MALKSNTQNFFQKLCWGLGKKFDCEVEEKQMVRYTWYSLETSSLVIATYKKTCFSFENFFVKSNFFSWNQNVRAYEKEVDNLTGF